MDTSEQNIKMCGKAWEIQAMRGDGLWLEGDFKVFITAGLSKIDDPPKPELPYYIWLPLQHQLQEMVGGYDPKVFHDFVTFVIGSSYLECWGDWPDNWSKFTSMEQLWLAFVMKEKYNKVWNATKEDWVKL